MRNDSIKRHYAAALFVGDCYIKCKAVGAYIAAYYYDV